MTLPNNHSKWLLTLPNQHILPTHFKLLGKSTWFILGQRSTPYSNYLCLRLVITLNKDKMTGLFFFFF